MKIRTITSLFVLSASLALPVKMLATNVLYWADYSVGTDNMAAALTALPGSYNVTFATGDSDFASLLGGGGYDLAILATQNFPGSGYSSYGALSSYVTGGGRAIFQDWYTSDSLAVFGAAYTGNVNDGSVTVTDSALSLGLGSNPLSLSNPGWGIYSTGLSGGTSAATFSSSDSAIVIGNGGRTIVNGFLTDTIANGTDAQTLYTNEILYTTSTATPDSAASLQLVAMGVASILMFRSRRRRA